MAEIGENWDKWPKLVETGTIGRNLWNLGQMAEIGGNWDNWPKLVEIGTNG